MVTVVAAGNQYLTGLTLYFIGYVIFEVSQHIPDSRFPHWTTAHSSADPLQHHSQADDTTALASNPDHCLGHRGYPARRSNQP